ncbi:hypothetical protein L9F63_004818, partial [Diploptera punctata]
TRNRTRDTAIYERRGEWDELRYHCSLVVCPICFVLLSFLPMSFDNGSPRIAMLASYKFRNQTPVSKLGHFIFNLIWSFIGPPTEEEAVLLIDLKSVDMKLLKMKLPKLRNRYVSMFHNMKLYFTLSLLIVRTATDMYHHLSPTYIFRNCLKSDNKLYSIKVNSPRWAGVDGSHNCFHTTSTIKNAKYSRIVISYYLGFSPSRKVFERQEFIISDTSIFSTF